MKKNNLIRKVKQTTAGLLTAAMALTGAPLGSLTSQAAGLLPNTDLHLTITPPATEASNKYVSQVGNFTYGSSDSTAFVFGPSSGHQGTNSYGADTYTFNFAGITDADSRENNTRGYYDNSQAGSNASTASAQPTIRSAFSGNWWHGYYAFGKPYRIGTDVQNKTGGTPYNATNPLDPVVGTWSGDEPSSATAPAAGTIKPLHTGAGHYDGEVQTLTDGAGNSVQLRQEIKPSDDDQYVVIQYTAYNPGTNPVDFMVGNETDTMVTSQDSVPIFVTPHEAGGQFEGVHFQNSIGGQYGLTIFDIYTSGNGAGLVKRDANDPSENRVWVGHWSSTANVDHCLWVFSQSRSGFINPGDSAGAFSTYFNLLPGETKISTFIGSIKPSVYYVKAGATGTDTSAGTAGFMGNPVGSIADAVAQIRANGAKKAYIYLQTDTTVDNTITIPNGTDITIQTADYNPLPAGQSYGDGYNHANTPPIKTDGPATIKRGDNLTGPLFKVVDNGSALNFRDVTVDGNKAHFSQPTVTAKPTAPIIEATAGSVGVKAGSTFTNAYVDDASTGSNTPSVMDISGSAVLDLNSPGGSASITGNESLKNGPAIKITSSANPTLNGTVNITGNNMQVGGATPVAGNVSLGNKPFMVKKNNEVDSATSIGVTLSQNMPTATGMGTTLIDYVGRPATDSANYPYSVSNFNADTNGQHIVIGDQASAVTGAAATNVQNQNVVYITTDMQDLVLTYVDENGASIPFSRLVVPTVSGAPAIDANPYQKTYAVGSQFEIPMSAPAGYTFDAVDTSAGALPTGVTVDASGKLTATMPSQDLNITIKLKRNEVRYKFDTQGGNTITDLVEPVNPTAASTLTMPTPVKAGYVFNGWHAYTDVDGNGSFNTGDTDLGAFAAFPNPATAGVTRLYATWTPGTTPYAVIVTHKNANPALPVTFATDTNNYTITQHVTADPLIPTPGIPGYIYDSATRLPASQGTLNATTGHYDLPSMPAMGISVNYRYKVDVNTTFNYTVRHQDASGNPLAVGITAAPKRAEQAITAAPKNITGYTFDHFVITTGDTPNPATYVLGLSTPGFTVTSNPTTDGVFSGYMPNQDVIITYVYNADAGSNLIKRYFDRITNTMLASEIEQLAPSAAISAVIPALGTTTGDKLYGYTWVNGSSTIDMNPAGIVTVNASNGNVTGNMPTLPPSSPTRVDWKLDHDAGKWKNVNFAVSTVYNNGTLVSPASHEIIVSDTTPAGDAAAYTFNRMKAFNFVPNTTPNRYYQFDGWFEDDACTIPVNDARIWHTTDSNPITLYAKFGENPNEWFDINFAAGSNGSISAPATLHVPYDYTWNQISTQLPTATPVANYIFNGWKDPNGTPMQATSTLTNHATYTAIFSQDPNTWGTNTGNITPTGRIGNDGSGEIVIDGTTPGNVYVISDPNGNIVAVVPGDSVGNRTVVPNLIPGAHYNVQEGTPDTHATVGQPISSITGTSVSTPQDVYVPTVDSNYNIGYDPDNDGMAQIVINPADPDADYALIDENGNVVPYPGSDNGWMTPVGNNPSTVTFNNLNPNETYTVVARKKGDSSIPNPLTKLPDGNQIVANPGDMADAPKYVVETKDGSVVSVGTTNVGNDTYDQAKAGDTVSIHADPVNANGKNFLYWQVLAGRAVGVSGNITQADYTFTLSNSNIVLKAVYEPTKIAGDDADLTETIRGGSAGEFGLDPNQIPGLANTLTTPLDRSLNSVNGANIEYKVVFNKRDAKTNEKTAVKPVSISGIDHPDAHTAAYGLDIQLERYVNGRLVNNGIVATASNATVDVIAQLPAEDVDQLDYQLYDVTPDNAGNITPVEVTITTDVANNAGLLKFTGNLQHSYVLVYSKTFKVTFIDNKPVLDNLHLNDTSRNFYKRFKIRRKENVEDSYYSSDYATVTAYAQNDVANALVTPFEDIYGVQYDYKNWSKKEDKLSVYDTTSPVTKRTVVYAYYSDNRKEVAKARVDLGDTIDIAKDLTGDPYLKAGEVAEINAAIAHALETLRQARDLVSPDGTTYLRQANWAELQQAIDALRALINKYSKGAGDRAAERNRRTGGASGGGNSSSGRGSKLLTPGEKSQQSTARNEGSNVRAFVLGVDGAWETNPVTKGWSFVLNGGTPINDMWGMITFDDSTGKKVSRWYYFDGQSTMATGWVYDSKNGNWYYMNTNEGPDLGQMVTGWVKDPKTNKWYYMNDNTGILVTGWHLDKQDGRWYYLNQNGEMLTGWQNIGGKWYYFNTNTPQNTYAWDAAAFKWNYLNNNVRPYGSMYAGEKTPDGYTVDANGAWN